MNHRVSLSGNQGNIDNQIKRFYNAGEVEAISYAAAQQAVIATLGVLGITGNQRKHLDNGTAKQIEQAMTATEVDSMAKERIKRRITIDGATHWVTGNTEQEYAMNLCRAMAGSMPAARPQGGKHDFATYARNWYEVFSKPNVADVTARTYERQLRHYIIPAFNGMMVEDVTTADVQRLFNGMDTDTAKKTKSTKDKVKMVLNMVLEHAVEDGLILRNPMRSNSLRIKGEASTATQPYTVEQMRYIVAHIGDVQNPMDKMYIALQALHPFRPEEVLGLRWKDIDLDTNTIHICSTVTHPDRNQPLFLEKTKTEKSNRIIPLVTQIKSYLLPGKPDEFVVGGETPLSYQQVRRMRERIQKDMKFDEAITPRRFRTTVLTDLYDQTKDIKQTQAAAGHTTAAMTLKYYVKGRSQQGNTAAPVAAVYGLAAM